MNWKIFLLHIPPLCKSDKISVQLYRFMYFQHKHIDYQARRNALFSVLKCTLSKIKCAHLYCANSTVFVQKVYASKNQYINSLNEQIFILHDCTLFLLFFNRGIFQSRRNKKKKYIDIYLFLIF